MAATAEGTPQAVSSRNNTPRHMIADFKDDDDDDYNDNGDFGIEDEEDLEPMTLELIEDDNNNTE